MGHRGLTVAAAVAVIAACGAAASRPLRYEVEGLSMAPGLLPGDTVSTGWFPGLDRRRSPGRFERWIVEVPGGGEGVKRVAGLPGETVSIEGGDLAVAGTAVLAAPDTLAGRGTRLDDLPERAGTADAQGFDWRHVAAPGLVLDDAPFAPGERRLLLPVHDVGLAAILEVQPAAAGPVAARIAVAVGPRMIRWRIGSAGRFGMAAGRLDGRLVGVVWPLPPDAAAWTPQLCLPPDAPAAWDVASRWPQEPPAEAAVPETEDHAPRLALGVAPVGDFAEGGATAQVVVVAVTRWRDVLLRPAADGVVAWRLGPDECLVLGDFSAGSRDSRHWGPLRREQLLHRVSRVGD